MINRTFTWFANTRPGNRYVTRRIVDRADQALTVTVDTGNCGPGHHITATLLERYGTAAAAPLALAWTGAALGGHRNPDAQPRFIDAATGQQTDSTGLSQAELWAAQLLAARARDDADMCVALLGALPGDCREHLRELLHVSALLTWARSRA